MNVTLRQLSNYIKVLEYQQKTTVLRADAVPHVPNPRNVHGSINEKVDKEKTPKKIKDRKIGAMKSLKKTVTS